jgi:Zn finger protein HypA/HybF involved in hydrogenase expression
MEINLRQIAEGYYNLLLSGTILEDSKVEELAKKRLEICEDCTHNGAPTLLGGHCTMCGCLMSAKSRSMPAQCPKSKW